MSVQNNILGKEDDYLPDRGFLEQLAIRKAPQSNINERTKAIRPSKVRTYQERIWSTTTLST